MMADRATHHILESCSQRGGVISRGHWKKVRWRPAFETVGLGWVPALMSFLGLACTHEANQPDGYEVRRSRNIVCVCVCVYVTSFRPQATLRGPKVRLRRRGVFAVVMGTIPRQNWLLHHHCCGKSRVRLMSPVIA